MDQDRFPVNIIQALDNSRFQIECFGFSGDQWQCTQEHKNIAEEALNEAYDVWVKQLGFNEPRLKHVITGISVVQELEPTYILIEKYEFALRPSFGDG